MIYFVFTLKSRQGGVLHEVQTILAVSFFKNVQDTTLLKIPIAETSSNPDFLDFSVSNLNQIRDKIKQFKRCTKFGAITLTRHVISIGDIEKKLS